MFLLVNARCTPRFILEQFLYEQQVFHINYFKAALNRSKLDLRANVLM